MGRSARSPEGFRPRFEGDFPTLGWGVLQWTHDYLPSPSDESRQLVFTDAQARHVLEAYRIDPVMGERVYRRGHEEQAKGWGKSPFGAALAITEFRGPVCFDGWDANGQPVGVPWGYGGRRSPWVQVAAVSEAQTYNTWRMIFTFLSMRRGSVADDLEIDVGRTLLYRKDNPAAFMERVTASAGSREGQELTFALIDEPQLYTPGNHGDTLAATILRNVAKTGGWALFTGNAPVEGKDTVAEMLGAAAPDVLFLARRARAKPLPEWTDEELLAELEYVYDGVPWINPRRLLSEVRDPKAKWGDMLRFFFNWRVGLDEAGESWMPTEAWDACATGTVIDPGRPVFACVRVAHDHRTAAVAYAQREGDRVHLRAQTFGPPDGESDSLDLEPVERAISELHRLYPARVLGAKRWTPNGRERLYPLPGPEVAYHGAFFERSAQELKKAGLVLVDFPNSQERMAPASEQLLELVQSGRLVHDGLVDLDEQVYAVQAQPAVKGWKLQSPAEGRRIEAAVAAMIAVERAMKAPAEPSRKMRGFRG